MLSWEIFLHFLSDEITFGISHEEKTTIKDDLATMDLTEVAQHKKSQKKTSSGGGATGD